MRILHLVDGLRVGGKERQLVELLKGLRRDKSIETMVVTMGEESFYVPDVVALGIPLVFLLRKVRWDPLIFWRLLSLLRRFRPHIIHTNSSMATFYAWPLARLMGIKLINGTIRNAFSGHGLRWQWHKLMLRMADARVGNSKAGFASRGWGYADPGNHVIYNGFDMERFENRAAARTDVLGFDPAGRKVAIMVAEFSDYKDYATFVRAAQMVLAKRNDVMFVAVGGGKNLEACRQMAANDPFIRFLGARKDVEALVRQSDMGLLCTYTEGISNSVMEYMAAGKPAIVTDGGGSSELVVEGENGHLVPQSDPAAVAEKVEGLLNDSAKATRMGAAGRESIQKRFTLEQLTGKNVEMYRDLLKPRNNSMTGNPTSERTGERLRFHYEVEKDLADRLRRATPKERRAMYGKLYDELYTRVKDHPLLQRKKMTGEEAGNYRGVHAQMGLLRNFLDPAGVFLEVGAGSCLLSMQAAANVKRVISLDVSKEMASRPDLPANMEIRIFDGIEIPIEPGSVNVAYSHQVMEHVHPDDAIEQLEGIYRALAPGGVYLCVVPNRLSGPHDISRYFDTVASGFHMKEYTTGELSSIFRKIGFRRTRSYIGARGHYFSVPKVCLKTLEAVLDSLPFGFRRAIARRPPLRPLLEIRMAGWK